jgi:hypothetical protein
MAMRRRNAGLALCKVLVSPHPGVSSPTQKYIKELNGVLGGSGFELLEPTLPETDTIWDAGKW